MPTPCLVVHVEPELVSGRAEGMSPLEFGPQAQGFPGSAAAHAPLGPVGVPCCPASSKALPCGALLLGVRQPFMVQFTGELIKGLHGDSPPLACP